MEGEANPTGKDSQQTVSCTEQGTWQQPKPCKSNVASKYSIAVTSRHFFGRRNALSEVRLGSGHGIDDPGGRRDGEDCRPQLREVQLQAWTVPRVRGRVSYSYSYFLAFSSLSKISLRGQIEVFGIYEHKLQQSKICAKGASGF